MLTPNHSSSQSTTPAVQAPRYPPQYRPASSIYSQPSPATDTFAPLQVGDIYIDPNEISPPSSPDLLNPRNGGASYDAGDVSPLEETDKSPFAMNQSAPSRLMGSMVPTSASSAQQRTAPESTPRGGDSSRTNIPMMRRERRKNMESSSKTLQPSQSRDQLRSTRPHGNDVRWDPRTGEPTTSNKGRPSQVNPHQYVEGLSQAKPPTGPPQARGQQPISPFGEKVRLKPVQQHQPSKAPTSAPAPPPMQAAKPEWRGGSGRTTLVAPVADNEDVNPLAIPARSSRRPVRDTGVLSPVGSVGSEATSPPPEHSAIMKSQVPSQGPPAVLRKAPSRAQTEGEKTRAANVQSSYPSPPPSSSTVRATPPENPRLEASQAPQAPEVRIIPAQAQPIESSQTLNDRAIRRKPAAGQTHAPHLSTSSSVYSTATEQPPPPTPAADDWTQPPSRFSVTTYATSSVETPRPSIEDAPPVPTPPREFSESPNLGGSSILDRKRPVVSGYEHLPRSRGNPDPIKLNLNSPYMTPDKRPAGLRTLHGNHSTLSITSVTSVDKSLPLAPPEESARDRVTQLNARLEALGNRRININHAIKQMTELMPTDNILASEAVIRKRESEKRKVETLKEELADVQREEYQIGLKLHRAYKRMDREAEFEPTTLWVRRAGNE
ncbi:hypothetical protein BX600DRAFT_194594 [Xylariales sp. PMI_506]|nr:hypothetical protein BX600DRAFT_194594 [Xylariales sp. PMI_506]